MKIWRPEEVKELRLRLGWSAADFSRHFKYHVDIVIAWEIGDNFPSATDKLLLERLEFDLEDYSDMLHKTPTAEIALNRMGLSQICLTEIYTKNSNS
ncbi:MAG: hypothetical protein A2Z20_00930 [Bdellovibrionales bacterium RBG_16_40_8]|nr:MAG: hypothetical protein A2Z20_00930 [Bdellovibrionales bacterium RBG_16_40_8]